MATYSAVCIDGPLKGRKVSHWEVAFLAAVPPVEAMRLVTYTLQDYTLEDVLCAGKTRAVKVWRCGD